MSLERFQHLDGRDGGIQPDAVADAAVPVGIIGQHQGDAPVFGRFPPQRGPVGGHFANETNAVGNGFVFDDIGLAPRIAPGPALEGNGAAHDAAIDLGQGHVHGDVAGAEAPG